MHEGSQTELGSDFRGGVVAAVVHQNNFIHKVFGDFAIGLLKRLGGVIRRHHDENAFPVQHKRAGLNPGRNEARSRSEQCALLRAPETNPRSLKIIRWRNTRKRCEVPRCESANGYLEAKSAANLMALQPEFPKV